MYNEFKLSTITFATTLTSFSPNINAPSFELLILLVVVNFVVPAGMMLATADDTFASTAYSNTFTKPKYSHIFTTVGCTYNKV